MKEEDPPQSLKNFLYDLYWHQKLSLNEIDGKLNKYHGFAEYWLRKYQIPTRSRLEAYHIKKTFLSEEARRKISDALTGIKRSKLTRLKLSVARRQKKYETPSKNILFNLYVHKGFSAREVAKKLGIPNHGVILNLLKIYDIPIRSLTEAAHQRYVKYDSPTKGVILSDETKRKISQKLKGRVYSQLAFFCLNCGKSVTVRKSRKRRFCSRSCSYTYHRGKPGHPMSLEARKKISDKRKGMKFTESHCRKLAIHRRNQKIPKSYTKPELSLIKICKQHQLPFKYVGDGAFWIGKINPDFIHIKDKVALEVFGDYWHSPLLRPQIRNEQRFDYRIRYAKSLGWAMIVFWESELNSLKAVSIVLRRLNDEKVL